VTSRPGVRVLLLDVEGTTTATSFVYDVLFPFARAHLREFLQADPNDPATRQDLSALRAERQAEAEDGAPEWGKASPAEALASAAAYAEWLMDRDRKSTALKSLQGRIWKDGYRSGTLKSHVYPDVRPALERCRAQRRSADIFSSGSVLAQRLLFEHTTEGDLTPLIHGYFDTTTGPKKAANSYRRIAEALRVAPAAVLFVSDVPAELDAAREAGMGTTLCVRGDAEPPATEHPVLRTFDEI
jgi:enolase-phosphatase E1